MDPSDHATQLLNRLGAGERDVEPELLALVQAELHDLARRHMAREAQNHTLQPTALLNEVWVRLFQRDGGASFEARKQFYALASRVMRSVLVDHARRRNADKRGGKERPVALDTQTPASDADPVDALDLDEALCALEASDDELARLVELRYFGGLTVPQLAEQLGIAQRTAERRLRAATAWLRERLGG